MADPLEREFSRRKPWLTKFVIQGRPYGGNYDAAGDPRLQWFQAQFPLAGRILELGSLEGGHSFALAALPQVKQVTAVEGRRDNLRRAQFVQTVLNESKVRFVAGNLETLDLSGLGDFDVALCLGLLYHLPEPWKLLERLARVTPALYMWTHYADEPRAHQVRHGYRGRLYREWFFFFEALSGLSPGSFWPTRADLLRMIKDAGFQDIRLVHDDPGHTHGPAITLMARRG